MKKFLFTAAFFYLTLPIVVYAASTPVLISPENNASINDSSPKLSWQYSDSCPTDTTNNCFKVDVDDSSDFFSINKSTYTNNLYYSPQNLSFGVWYWRVKAKDQAGNWSDYQNSSFKIEEINQIETTPFPTSSASSLTGGSNIQQSKDEFLVSNLPANIFASKSFSVNIVIANLEPNSLYFIKGAFFKSGSTNYFGKTLVSGNWVKNSQSYTNQVSFTTDNSGNWQGTMTLLVDNEDSGFLGSGEYSFKAGRYNSSGSGPTWSDTQGTRITDDIPPASSSPKVSSAGNKASSSPFRTANTSNTPAASTSILKSNLSKSGLVGSLSKVRIASIEGEASQASLIKNASLSNNPNFLTYLKNYLDKIFIGVGGVLFGVSCFTLVKVFKKG